MLWGIIGEPQVTASLEKPLLLPERKYLLTVNDIFLLVCMETVKYSPIIWCAVLFFLDCISEMTQAANQELLHQHTSSLPPELLVVNDIAEKKLRLDLWKGAKKVKNYRSTDDIFPLHTVTEDWKNVRKRRTEKVNGWHWRVEFGFWVHNFLHQNDWLNQRPI